jgi:lipopolysaccharide transport system permease protein
MKEEIKIIRPGTTSLSDYLAAVWNSRSLIYTFAWQELKVQYAQTMLGVLWAVLRPMIILAIFTLIFALLIQLKGVTIPYPLFAFSGLIAWNYFNFIVSNGSSVIINNQNLIRKFYFPKIILLLSKSLVGLVEFFISLVLMFVLALILRFQVSIHPVWLLFFILANLLTGLTVALWLSALSVRFRDINQFVLPLIGFVIWLTPVFYPGTLIPEHYQYILFFNPLAGIVQGYRYAILGGEFLSVQYFYTFAVVGLLFFAGLLIFIRVEDEMPDYL